MTPKVFDALLSSASKALKSLLKIGQNSQPGPAQTKVTKEISKGPGTNKLSDSPPDDEHMFDGDFPKEIGNLSNILATE